MPRDRAVQSKIVYKSRRNRSGRVKMDHSLLYDRGCWSAVQRSATYSRASACTSTYLTAQQPTNRGTRDHLFHLSKRRRKGDREESERTAEPGARWFLLGRWGQAGKCSSLHFYPASLRLVLPTTSQSPLLSRGMRLPRGEPGDRYRSSGTVHFPASDNA